MTGLLIACAKCHREYEPTRDEIMRGIKQWRLCPDCREHEAAVNVELEGEQRFEPTRKES